MKIRTKTDVTPEIILGKTFTEIIGLQQDSYEVVFKVNDREYFKMHHYQDCCESVLVEDVVGNIDNLLNTPILGYEVKSFDDDNASESATFTFYTLRTIKGYVDIRWYGESNGYYSEEVDFEQYIEEDIEEGDLVNCYDVMRLLSNEEFKSLQKWYDIDGRYNSYFKKADVTRVIVSRGN